jgi:hypothetical protein
VTTTWVAVRPKSVRFIDEGTPGRGVWLGGPPGVRPDSCPSATERSGLIEYDPAPARCAKLHKQKRAQLTRFQPAASPRVIAATERREGARAMKAQSLCAPRKSLKALGIGRASIACWKPASDSRARCRCAISRPARRCAESDGGSLDRFVGVAGLDLTDPSRPRGVVDGEDASARLWRPA